MLLSYLYRSGNPKRRKQKQNRTEQNREKNKKRNKMVSILNRQVLCVALVAVVAIAFWVLAIRPGSISSGAASTYTNSLVPQANHAVVDPIGSDANIYTPQPPPFFG